MMSKGSTRKGYTQAILNLKTGKLFAAELILVAIAIGVYFTSWYGFGAVLITLSIFSYFRGTGFILAIALSCLWSALAAANACIFQGVDFFQDSLIQSALSLFSTPASCVLGIIFFTIGLQFHLTGIEWVRDILDPIGRNMPKIPGFTNK